MRLNLLNKAVILSGILLVKASEDVVRVEDAAIEQWIGDNISRISEFFHPYSFYDGFNEHIKFLQSVSSYLEELIIPGPIPTNPSEPLDICGPSKTKLNTISPKDDKLTTSFGDNDGRVHLVSETVGIWFKELLKTAFFNRNLLTAETRENAGSGGIITSEDIRSEIICSHILSNKDSGWLLMHLRNLILSELFKAIGADSESIIPKIDACLKKIIESLGKASEKGSKYLSKPNNLNWEKNVKKLWEEREEIILQKESEKRERLSSIYFIKRMIRLFNKLFSWIYPRKRSLQSSSEILPEISEESPILDNKNLETLRKDLERLYSKEIRPAIDEILSYYYLFLYVSINNAKDKKLSKEGAARYYDLRNYIKSLDNISLLLCDIPEITQHTNIKLNSHMICDSDYLIFREYQTTNFRFSVEKLHKENGGNTPYIDLSKALEKFDDFKNHYTEDLIGRHGTGGRYDYSSIIKNLANHLLYITYDVTKEMLNEIETSSNSVQNANSVGSDN